MAISGRFSINASRLILSGIMLLTTLLLSCTGGGIQVIENEQTGVTVYRLSGVYAGLNKKVGGSYGQVDFGAEKRIETRPDDTLYALFAAPLVLGGLNVAVGDRLEFVIDRDTVEIPCTRVLQAKRGIQMGNPVTGRGQYYLETLRYEVDPSVLQRIAFAGSVTYTIHGRDKDLPGEFTAGNLKRFRSFYEQYVFRKGD